MIFDAPFSDGQAGEGVAAVEEFEESSGFEEELGNFIEGERVFVGERRGLKDVIEAW